MCSNITDGLRKQPTTIHLISCLRCNFCSALDNPRQIVTERTTQKPRNVDKDSDVLLQYILVLVHFLSAMTNTLVSGANEDNTQRVEIEE